MQPGSDDWKGEHLIRNRRYSEAEAMTNKGRLMNANKKAKAARAAKKEEGK